MRANKKNKQWKWKKRKEGQHNKWKIREHMPHVVLPGVSSWQVMMAELIYRCAREGGDQKTMFTKTTTTNRKKRRTQRQNQLVGQTNAPDYLDPHAIWIKTTNDCVASFVTHTDKKRRGYRCSSQPGGSSRQVMKVGLVSRCEVRGWTALHNCCCTSCWCFSCSLTAVRLGGTIL